MQLRLLPLLLVACTPGGGVVFLEPAASGFADTGTTEPPTSAASDEVGEPPPPPPASDTGSDASTGEPPANGPLVPAQAVWRYSVSAPPDGWTAPEFADASWPEGQAPIGDDAEVTTAISTADAPVGLWLRRRCAAIAGPGELLLYLRRGDGAAVYLNGAELTRSNLPAGPLAADALAEDDLDGDEVRRYMRFVVPADAVRDGDNVVAVALRRAAVGEPGLGFDLQLERFAPAATAELTVQWRTRSYAGEYAADNVGAAWIERAGGGFVRTLSVWAEVRREHLVRWRQGSDSDTVDAVTSATRSRHRTSEVAWDLRDAGGTPVEPGAYRLLLEFTEDDSNKGAPPGPLLELPFTLGAGPAALAVPDHPQFRDVLVISP